MPPPSAAPSVLRSRTGRPWRWILAACCVLAVTTTPAAAQTRASDPDAELVVGILTMGQGDLVYELFGHNAIWIHDPARGTSRVYNYGVFDFDSPGYWSRFVKGTWLYQLAVTDLRHTLFTYEYLNRSVWLQVLNLAPAQKRELRDFLEWNALPQNRDYLYDYYRDNCSTRVRDAIDRVIGGALRARTEGVPTGTTYRWHSERLSASDRLSYTGLLIGLGPAADREIDAWEEMFIPFKVQERIRELQVEDETGRLVPLVASEETLYSALNRTGALTEPPRRAQWYALAGLAVLAILAGAARTARPARGIITVVGVAWGFVAGSVGLLLLAVWALTNHTIAYGNASLLQMNPLALGLVVLLPAVATGAPWAVWPARTLTAVLAALSAAGVILWLLPWFVQANGPVIALALPVNLGLAVAVARLGTTARPQPAGGRGARHSPARAAGMRS